MSVADLLRNSMTVHDRAKSLRLARDRAGARQALVAARDLRLQALSEDPERKDPAWAEEQKRTPVGADTHESLLAFYRDQLDR